jgi:hypothetical protein
MRKGLLLSITVFAVAIVLSSQSLAVIREKREQLICGGLNAGFDAQNHPILITEKNIGLLQSKMRRGLPKISGEIQITLQTDSTTRSIKSYIDLMASAILPVIEDVYGSPFTSATVTVSYDSTLFPWFYYNPVEAKMVISALPGKASGGTFSPNPYQHDDDGDGKTDEDPFDGVDNDGDGKIDEDLNTDPLWDGVVTHELIHAFHTGAYIFGLAWFEEGMTECASQMVMLILREEKKRLISRAEPDDIILFYDTWNQLGKEMVGGAVSPSWKMIPNLWYDAASTLFWILTLSQSGNTPAGKWREIEYLVELNKALLAESKEWHGILPGAEVINATKIQSPKLIDGLNLVPWLGKQNVTSMVGHVGKYLGVCAHHNTVANESYWAVTNPEVLSIIGIEKLPDKLHPELKYEVPIINFSSIDVKIYNRFNEIIWRNEGISVMLSDSNGVNNVDIGKTQLWEKGAYRIEATAIIDEGDTLTAKNYFLVTGPMSSPGDIFDSAEEGLGIIVLPPFEASVDSLLQGVEGSFAWNARGGAVLQSKNLASSEVWLAVLRDSAVQTFSLPNPYTRIVMSESPATQSEKLLAGWPAALSPEPLEWVEWAGVDDIDSEWGKEVVALVENQQAWGLNANGSVHTGWPISNVKKIHGFYNIDNTPGKEIFLQTTTDSKLYVYNGNGEQVTSPISIEPITSNLLFLNIYGDSLPEIIVGSNDSLYAYNRDGSIVPNYPIALQDIASAKITALEGGDLDGDGKNEIVVIRGVPFGYSEQLYISLMNEDGSLRQGWPQEVGYKWLSDNDTEEEGIDVSFPLGDIDGDGKAEIICAVGERVVDRFTVKDGLLTVFQLDGTTMKGFPLRFPDYSRVQPILADLNNDKLPEIIVSADHPDAQYFYELFVFDSHGEILPNWPTIRIEGRFTGLICGDVDGDKEPEIISSGNGIFLWNADGSSVPGSPYTETFGSEPWYKLFFNPTLADLDGDGETNLIANSLDGVYVWDLKGVQEDSLMPWPMFKHDNNHSSFYGPVHLSPDYVAANQPIPQTYELFQNYPNPFNSSTVILFSLPSKSYVLLKVFDMLGREVATLVNEELAAGNHYRQWIASNISSGVYFYRLQCGSFIETKKLVLLR